MLRGLDTAAGEAAFCAHCQQDCPEGPDVCLGLIEGVDEACCGHGWVTTPFVSFGDERVEGRKAISWFKQHGVGPPPVQTVSVFMFEMYDGGVTVKAEYEYESLRLIAVRWFNATLEEPLWRFDDVEVTLTNGNGTVPLPNDLYCRETSDGLVDLPFARVETI